MAAVGALAGVGVAGGVGQHGGVVPLLFRGGLVGHGGVHVLRGVVPRQDAGHRRPGEGVVDALHRGQGHAEGGGLGVEQPAPGVALHHREAHPPLLAELVELRPLRGYAAQALSVGLRLEIGVQVVAGGEQVEGWVDAEQQHLHLPGEDG